MNRLRDANRVLGHSYLSELPTCEHDWCDLPTVHHHVDPIDLSWRNFARFIFGVLLAYAVGCAALIAWGGM